MYYSRYSIPQNSERIPWCHTLHGPVNERLVYLFLKILLQLNRLDAEYFLSTINSFFRLLLNHYLNTQSWIVFPSIIKILSKKILPWFLQCFPLSPLHSSSQLFLWTTSCWVSRTAPCWRLNCYLYLIHTLSCKNFNRTFVLHYV